MRSRSRSYEICLGGSSTSLVPYLYGTSQGPYYEDEYCSDVVGDPFNPHNLRLDKWNHVGCATTGRVSQYYECSGWIDTIGYAGSDIYDGLFDLPSISDSALEGMKLTNINKPSVDVPVFLFELRDLPGMVKHLGDRIIRAKAFLSGAGKRYTKDLVAEDWLALNFGWKPLIQDLGHMLDFVGDVDKRLLYLDRLYSERGLRRKQTVWKKDISMAPKELYVGPLYANNCRVRLSFDGQCERWVTVHWTPASKPKFVTDDEKLTLARKLVWGFNTIDAASLWEAMPWSWLFDWFGSVGDYLDAHRNGVPCQATEVCVMTHVVVRVKDVTYLSNPYGAKVTPFWKPIHERKFRDVASSLTAPSFHLPFLSGKQLSILSALAITRKFGQSA